MTMYRLKFEAATNELTLHLENKINLSFELSCFPTEIRTPQWKIMVDWSGV